LKAHKVSPLSYVIRAGQLAWQAFQERRLPLSPRRWLVDLRHLRGVMATGEPVAPPPRLATAAGAESERESITREATRELQAFLEDGSRLKLEYHASPLVSVVLVLYNRAELTLRCLRSIAACSLPTEVVLVDNASSDRTPALIERVPNVVVIRHWTNEGFSAGVNAGTRVARGKYLLLLNNDTELLPGCLEAAVERAENTRDIGAVGGKLILPGGRLQEAGSIIWSDGSCLGYGRDDSPCAPEYSFSRDVDFCSAAFLLTPRELFLQLGGFDLVFSPAYYEDADYCVRLWEAGRRVVYEPACGVMHFEFASSGAKHLAIQRQLEKKATFAGKHAGWLKQQPRPDPANVLNARSRSRSGRRVLVFDDRVPHTAFGSGFPRAVEMLRQLTDLGHFVTLYPLSFPTESWDSVYTDIPGSVEVMTDHGLTRMADFLAKRRGYYDTIIVSRHHNMQRLRERLGEIATWGARVVYDAEAVAALRDVERQKVDGVPMRDSEASRMVREEIELARGVDAVLAVSDLEKQAFVQEGIRNVVVARHAVTVAPTPRSFADRNGFLFVGAFDLLSPNQDAVLWFAREVLPRVEALLESHVPFTVVGHNLSPEIRSLEGNGISVIASADELAPLYDSARAFVAPTRFAAGIPLKVIHAAANGVPVVCTSLLARQLGWSEGIDLLSGDSPADFARNCASLYSDEALWGRLRSNAMRRVETECSSAVLRTALREALDGGSGAI
jgi:O-antigen biosynthesis protein